MALYPQPGEAWENSSYITQHFLFASNIYQWLMLGLVRFILLGE